LKKNPFGIYEKILLGRLKIPSHFDSASRDFIKHLLKHDRTRRLGNMKNGALDVKNHRFFKGVVWEEVYNRVLRPPILPEVDDEDDTSMFEAYDEAEGYELCPSIVPVDPYADLFANF